MTNLATFRFTSINLKLFLSGRGICWNAIFSKGFLTFMLFDALNFRQMSYFQERSENRLEKAYLDIVDTIQFTVHEALRVVFKTQFTLMQFATFAVLHCWKVYYCDFFSLNVFNLETTDQRASFIKIPILKFVEELFGNNIEMFFEIHSEVLSI